MEGGAKKLPWSHLVRIFCLAAILSFTVSTVLLADKAGKVQDFRLGYSLKTLHDVDMKDANAALAIWSKEIGRTKGFHVESAPYEEPLRLAEDLQSGKIDFGIFRAEDFVRLSSRINLDTPISPLRAGKKTHKYIILVRADSPLKELKDLKNKTITFLSNDEASRVFLDILLSGQKLQPAEKFFSATYYKQRSSQVVLSVFFGQSDAAVSNDTSFQTMVELNPQLGVKLRALASSPEYVAGLGTFRKDYDRESKAVVLDSLLGLSDSPRGKQVLMLFKAEKFVILQERELDSMRKLINEYDRLKVQK